VAEEAQKREIQATDILVCVLGAVADGMWRAGVVLASGLLLLSGVVGGAIGMVQV